MTLRPISFWCSFRKKHHRVPSRPIASYPVLSSSIALYSQFCEIISKKSNLDQMVLSNFQEQSRIWLKGTSTLFSEQMGVWKEVWGRGWVSGGGEERRGEGRGRRGHTSVDSCYFDHLRWHTIWRLVEGLTMSICKTETTKIKKKHIKKPPPSARSRFSTFNKL